MPVHDWTRVDAGTFRAFHTAWITHLSEALNGGLLPAGYYALPEQHAGRSVADILTLHTGQPVSAPAPVEGGLAVAEAPPQTSRRLTIALASRARPRTLAIRHISGHRVVALVELVSPANKDRARHVAEFTAKAASALALGIHLLIVDGFPPGAHDPAGMHGAMAHELDDESAPYELPSELPLTLASYLAGPDVEVLLEHVAVGSLLPDMPLYLSSGRHVAAPLEATYQAAFRGFPVYWRQTLEHGSTP